MYRYKNNISAFTIYYTSVIYTSIHIFLQYLRHGGHGLAGLWFFDPGWCEPAWNAFFIHVCYPRDQHLCFGLGPEWAGWVLTCPSLDGALGDPLAASLWLESIRGRMVFTFTFRTLCRRKAVKKKKKMEMSGNRGQTRAWVGAVSATVSRTRYWPHLPTSPPTGPPCHCRPSRSRAAPSAPEPSAGTARLGFLRSDARTWGGTAWSRRSLGSSHQRPGW